MAAQRKWHNLRGQIFIFPYQVDFCAYLTEFHLGFCNFSRLQQTGKRFILLVNETNKGFDGESTHAAKATASRGQCKPGASRTMLKITPELHTEPPFFTLGK